MVSKTFFDCQGVTQHPKKIFSSEFENCFYFVMFVVMQALCCEFRGFWLGKRLNCKAQLLEINCVPTGG